MKYLILSMTLVASAAQAQVYNYFSPGCALTGNATSQTVNLGTGACILGNLPVTNLASGTGATSTTFWRGDGSWSVPIGTAAGTTGQVQFNGGSSIFSASSALTFVSGTSTLGVGAATTTTSGIINLGGSSGTSSVLSAGQLTVSGKPLILTTTGGGSASLSASAGTGSAAGGNIVVTAGNTGASSSSVGGSVAVTGGQGNASAASGSVSIVGGPGYSTSGSAGSVNVQGGVGNTSTLSAPINFYTNSTLREQIPSIGGMTILPPDSGSALVVNGAASSNTIYAIGSGTSGHSFGLAVQSGTSSADYTADFINASGSQTFLKISGDGGITTNGQADEGAGTINASGFYAGGNIVPSVISSPTLTGNWSFFPSSGNGPIIYKASSGGIGLDVRAGASTSDDTMILRNNSSVTEWTFLGDGSQVSNGLSSEGTGTINAAGLYEGGVFVPNLASTPIWTGLNTFNNGVLINFPSTGNSLVVLGQSGFNAGVIAGGGSTGQSKGLLIQAGTNSSDYSLDVTNENSSNTYFIISGDGSIATNGQADEGIGTFNAAGLYIAGSLVTSVNSSPTLTGNWNFFPTTGNGPIIYKSGSGGIGLDVRAGTSSSDYTMILRNNGSGTEWSFFGDGSLTSNGQTDEGAGTINAAGLYVAGVPVTTGGPYVPVAGNTNLTGATGGPFGGGTINAAGLYVNGVAVTTGGAYVPLAGNAILTGATGGAKGSGTINATGLYVNGAAVQTTASSGAQIVSFIASSNGSGSLTITHCIGCGSTPNITRSSVGTWTFNVGTGVSWTNEVAVCQVFNNGSYSGYTMNPAQNSTTGIILTALNPSNNPTDVIASNISCVVNYF